MATIGLSKPYYAFYSNTGTTVSYSGGGVLGKYTELSLELDDGGDNILYGDNGPAESDTAFAGGTISITTDELRPAAAHDILGTKTEAVTVTGLTTQDASWEVYDEDQDAPYLGVGGILKKKVDGAVRYVAFVLNKVKFTTPGESATTQGETIEWQTKELSAKILRSDTAKHEWRRVSSLLDTEADAEKLIKSFLGIEA